MIYMKTVLWNWLGVLPNKQIHEELTLRQFCEDRTELNKQQVQAQQDEHWCKTQETAGYTWLWLWLTCDFGEVMSLSLVSFPDL